MLKLPVKYSFSIFQSGGVSCQTGFQSPYCSLVSHGHFASPGEVDYREKFGRCTTLARFAPKCFRHIPYPLLPILLSRTGVSRKVLPSCCRPMDNGRCYGCTNCGQNDSGRNTKETKVVKPSDRSSLLFDCVRQSSS